MYASVVAQMPPDAVNNATPLGTPRVEAMVWWRVVVVHCSW